MLQIGLLAGSQAITQTSRMAIGRRAILIVLVACSACGGDDTSRSAASEVASTVNQTLGSQVTDTSASTSAGSTTDVAFSAPEPAASTPPEALPTTTPLPSAEAIMATSEACLDVYGVLSHIDLGSYSPHVAKPIGAPEGCEISFDGPTNAGAVIVDAAFSLGYTPAPLDNRRPTSDADESEVKLSSGRTAFVDPTGPDGAGYVDTQLVSIPQPDGGIVFVMTSNPTTPPKVLLRIADQLDAALNQ